VTRYVHRVRGKDGVERLYLRKTGVPRVPLASPYGSRKLEVEVERLLAEFGSIKARPQTLEAAAREYETKTPEFRNLAESTKREYRYILGEFIDDLGEVPVSAFTPKFVMQLRDKWAERGHRAANLRLQLLKNVLKRSLIAGEIKKDPFALVSQVRRPSSREEPHRIWPDVALSAVVAAAVEQGRPGLARAIAVARYTGVRRGDLVKLTRSARQDGRIRFTTGKRKVAVDIPEAPQLTDWLSRLPDRPPNTPRRGRKVPRDATSSEPLTLAFNSAGRPYTDDGLGQELRKLVSALHAAGKIDSDKYDLHGLRHTRGVDLALAGCTDAQGAAMMGHGSPNSFTTYRRQADKVRLTNDAAAKLQSLRERAANESVKPVVEKVENPPTGTIGERTKMPTFPEPCDGTASPDRTEDLQSHNLAL